jgi:hypothetical protein
MHIETFKQIVKETDPCTTGWVWLLKTSKNCKNTDQFFEKCTRIKKKYTSI